jgi:hypothetical protein
MEYQYRLLLYLTTRCVLRSQCLQLPSSSLVFRVLHFLIAQREFFGTRRRAQAVWKREIYIVWCINSQLLNLDLLVGLARCRVALLVEGLVILGITLRHSPWDLGAFFAATDHDISGTLHVTGSTKEPLLLLLNL